MVFASPLPDVEIPDVPLSEYVLLGAVRSLAGGLVAKGFAKGDTLALMSPNIPEYAVVFHGVAMAGGTITTINPTYTEAEVHKQLVDSRASILVTVPMFLEVATAAARETSVNEIYVLGEAEGALPITALFGAPLAEQVPVSGDDVVVLPYSSGTTGLNKGVMLTHRNLLANVAQVLAGADVREDEKFIGVLPFFHIYGMQVLMNTGLRAGATVITMPRFDLQEFLRLHQDYGITRSFVAPPIVVALAKHPMVDDYDLSKLEQVFSGAAPLSAELAIEAGKRLGCDVVQGYGMTEMSPVSHLTPPGMFKPGSCGVTAPSTLSRIVDPVTGEDLGVDADGELLVKGPQVMAGYLGNQKATDDTLDRDGWLHTGDIGHIDSDGHLFIVDRLKELIKYKGFQVPPAELEALLLTHPAVADAAVVGLPDEEAGEIPVAHVVLRPGIEATEQEIMDFVAGQVSHYKQVRKVVITDAIPKSASGKILRRMLRHPG
jgi:acyl-CoA synthetase (AMP-forming)/AMP-acid ligase II